MTFSMRRGVASKFGKCLYRYFTVGRLLVLLPGAVELIGILRFVWPRTKSWKRIVLEEERLLLEDLADDNDSPTDVIASPDQTARVGESS